MLQNGVPPTEFYNTSMDDMTRVINAKSRDDRVQDPLVLARKAGLI